MKRKNLYMTVNDLVRELQDQQRWGNGSKHVVIGDPEENPSTLSRVETGRVEFQKDYFAPRRVRECVVIQYGPNARY